MKVNLKALLFASAATLAMSAVSAPAFAADAPTEHDKAQDQKIQANTAQITDTTKALQDNAKYTQGRLDKLKGDIGILYQSVGEMGANFEDDGNGGTTAVDTTARVGVSANADAIKQNSDTIKGLSNIATQTTDYDKTVGATAVDKVARNRLDENDSMNQIQNAAIDKNTKGVAKNSERLDENDSMNQIQNAAIDKNTKGVAKNSERLDENDSMNQIQNAAIDKNTKGVAKNSERLDENDSMNQIQNAAIDKNTKGVAKNAEENKVTRKVATDAQKDAARALTGQANDQIARDGVASNAQRIYEANQNIANTSRADRSYTDQVAQQTLKSANQYTDSRYNQLNGKLDKLRSRVDSGVAGATALASIPFSGVTKNSFGGSVAVANSKAAGAIGYQRNFTKHWSARGTVAFGDHYAQGGVGGSYNW